VPSECAAAITRRRRHTTPEIALRRTRTALMLALLGLAAPLGAGCHDTTAPTTGALRITVTTGGSDLDPDGYLVVVDNNPGRAVAASGVITVAGLGTGPHLVRLDGVAPNCAVSGANPRPVTVSPGSTASVTIAVACVATSGLVRVTVATTGNDLDSDGYALSVDGGTGRPVAVNDVILLPGLPLGDRTLRLDGVAPNCAVVGANPLAVRVVSGEMTLAEFQVECRTRSGSIRVTTTTTGPEPDPDGYSVLVDGGYPYGANTILSNGVLVLPDIPEGTHAVALAGVARNCAVSGLPTQPVRVTFGGTVDVAFAVTCVATGTLRVTTETTGVDPDPNGYRVRLAGAKLDTTVNLATGGVSTIAGLPPGDYAVTFGGVAANCDLAGPAPRAAAISSAQTTALSFGVACAPVTRIAFVRDGDIFTINSNGTGLTRLTTLAGTGADGAQNPAWSPDGSRIAFANTAGDIYVVNADGSNLLRLTSTGQGNRHPTWSPDGARIAFVSTRDGAEDIYVMNADGSSPVRLTNDRGSDIDPAWSPDGGRIAFTSDRSGQDEIYVMSPDGMNVRQLTYDPVFYHEPAWSPDGAALVFVRSSVPCDYYYYQCNFSIYVMGADGSGIRQLTPPNNFDDEPAWSPDGRWIAFSTAVCNPGCTRALAIVRADGSDRDVLVLDAMEPAWRR
jgi:Tol biopolymer transport system component